METNEQYQDVYIANGTQDTFALTFSFETDAISGLPKGIEVELTEYLGDGQYAEPRPLVAGTEFTLQAAAVQLTTPPPAQSIVVPYRNESLDQSRDFPGYSQEVENAIDKIHRILIDFSGKLKRIVRLDRAEAEQELVIPSVAIRANHYLYFDATGALSVRVGPVPKVFDPEYPFQTGELTQYSGMFWKSLIDNNTQTTPGTDDTKWEPVPFDLEYRSDKTYGLNRLAVWEGVLYTSLAAGNKGNQPDTSPTWWKLASAMTNALTLGGASLSTDETMNADSDSLISSQKATKAYSDSQKESLRALFVKPIIRNWTVKVPAADQQWKSIAWSPALGIFCAVCSDGTTNQVMTSPDGETWTIRTAAVSNSWSSIAWSPALGKFCAIGGSSGMTSPDGINWSVCSGFPGVNTWISIVWSPERSLFCMVAGSGTDNRAATSPDGDTWTLRTTPGSKMWQSVTWSPERGLFCAVGPYLGTLDRVMTSPDGVTWTMRNAANNNDWYSIAWSPKLSLFCAVAISGTGNRVMTSPDGITWTARTTPVDNNWSAITWAPDLELFCAVASSGVGNRIMTSPDGINWTTQPSAADNAWQSIAYSPDLSRFCALSTNGTSNRVMVSL